MAVIGSYQAKTHLPQLLQRVENGETITITKRGKPVAMLVPPVATPAKDVRHVVKEMLRFRDQEGPKLGGKATLRQLIEEGRRR